MFGRVPAYTDISHFRAPYKNAMISGYGAEEVTPPPPPPNGNGATNPFVTTDKRGYNFVASSIKPMLMQTLGMYGFIFQGGQFNNVKLTPFTNEELTIAASNPQAKAILDSRKATNWIAEQVDAGQVVFMNQVTLAAIMSGQALPAGSDQLGTFPAGSDQAKEAAKSPLGVVVAGDPDGRGFSIAGLGPIGIAIAAVAVVGGIAVYRAYGKDKRGKAGRMSLGSSL